MGQKKPYNILTDYVPTGCKAIDAVASCIMFHRERKIALKAIHLKQPYYDWFKVGTEILQGRKLEEGELMAMDGVDIELGSRFQSKTILPELWPVQKPEECN